MSNVLRLRQTGFGHRAQRGAATLLVTLVILVVLTVIILASTNVALFEQKTATNENRQRLAEQAAEYALNLAGEYMKVNVSKLSTNASPGWLAAGSIRWISCAVDPITDTSHPCMVEKDLLRREELYYYSADGNRHTAGSDVELNLPYDSLAPAAIKLTTTGSGGVSAFGTTAKVRALLCRVDSSLTTPACQRAPVAGQRIAVTLISSSTLAGENAAAVVKETWGTLSTSSFTSSTPLVAAGSVDLSGTFTIVDSPNAGGYGISAAVWSAKDTGGNGSPQSCQMEDYLGNYPIAQLTTNPGCAKTSPSTCACDTEVVTKGGPHEPDGIDILDRGDNDEGNLDITFFPGSWDYSTQAQREATRMDYRVCTGAGAPYADTFGNGCKSAGICAAAHPYCLTDDNLFEYTFGVDVTGGDSTVLATNCVVPAAFASATYPGDCELKALSDLGFKTIDDCSQLSATSSGLIYVKDTAQCNLPNGQVGKPASPVILVVNSEARVGATENFFGMLFVRSPASAPALNSATLSGVANGKFFGSIVVEGNVPKLVGTMDLVFMDTSAGSPNDALADSTRFARLPGSWLDSARGF